MFYKSMIFDVRNLLCLLSLKVGRAQTRRAWRLPFVIIKVVLEKGCLLCLAFGQSRIFRRLEERTGQAAGGRGIENIGFQRGGAAAG